MNKIDKFNKYEKILFKIHITILIFGGFLLVLLFLAEDIFKSVASSFITVVYSLLYITIINFIVSFVRLIKYLTVFHKNQSLISIRRTIAIILTSPISFGIFFIITLAMSLSLASCS